jgi:putative transposase
MQPPNQKLLNPDSVGYRYADAADGRRSTAQPGREQQRLLPTPLSTPFVETCAVKYDKAVGCLTKDREALLAFYDFPAEHWKHLRTTNPIGSTFATVRHQTVRSKGCLSNRTAIAMVFKLAQAAEKSWRRLDGHSQLPKLITGIKFIDGIEAVSQQPLAA